MTITLTCQDCKQQFEYPNNSYTNRKRFCHPCANKRKNECIKESNNSKPKSNNPLGRPVGSGKVEKRYGKDDAKMGWDEPNILGY